MATLNSLLPGGSSRTATGAISLEPVATVPADAVVCNGASLLRSEYPELFAAIGTTYGAVDATHFSVPDLRGRFLVAGSSATEVGTVLSPKLESHRHLMTVACGSNGWCGHFANNSNVSNRYTTFDEVTTDADNAPTNISVQYVIWT